jgi:hypothetical protein
MMSRVPVLVVAELAIACGGSVTSPGAGDAAGMDSSDDVPICPPPGSIPDASVYTCDAGPPGSVGCRAAGLDPNAAGDPHVYPEGCMVTLPTASTYCGPISCMCQAVPFADAGLEFVCPL